MVDQVWDRIIRAHPNLTEKTEQRRARLVAAVAFPYAFLSWLLTLYLWRSERSVWLPAVLASVVSAVYVLAKRGHWKFASELFLGAIILGGLGGIATQEHPTLILLAGVFLSPGILVASLLMSVRATLLTGAVALVGLVTQSMLNPSLSFELNLLVIYTMMTTVILALGAAVRERDISNILRATRELKESQEFFATIIDQLPVAVVCKDPQNDYRITLWNKLAEDVFGVQNALGRTDFDLFPAEQAEFFRRNDITTMQNHMVVEVHEEAVRSLSFGDLVLHTVKVPIYDLAGQPKQLLAVAEDVTNSTKAARELDIERVKVIEMNKMASLGEMSGGIAHEINNPLAIIAGKARIARLMLEDPTYGPGRVKNDLDAIERNVDRIAKIIHGLKTFTRDGSKDPFRPESVRVLIEDTLSLCKEKIMAHGIELTLPDLAKWDVEAECRGTQIVQVLVNLLSNAYDAVIDTTDPWIRFNLEEQDGHIVFVIANAGSPIPIEVRRRMFEPFYTTKAVGKGTGLGLSISFGIIKDHNGTLVYDESSPHPRFSLRLPRVQLGNARVAA